MDSKRLETFAVAPKPLSPVPTTGKDDGKHRIHVVDDDRLVLDSLSRLLTHSGYSVTSSQDPIRAYELISQCPSAFDLIVTDLRMPGMDGHELIRRLKEIGAALPFIVCSGTVIPQNDLIADCYCRKPVRTREFLEVVRSVIRNRDQV